MFNNINKGVEVFMKVIGKDMDLKNRDNWIAVIGGRNASEKELITAYNLSKRLVERGFVVVSGLAKGIDTYAHKGAIDGGGETIAIVSTSIDEDIYPPENKALSEKIKDNGCIIYPFDKPCKYTSYGINPRVRRLIERSILNAYVCSIIIVVSDNSTCIRGGTRWATKYGMDLNKRVYRYDTNNKWHENPNVQDCTINFIREIIQEDILVELDNYR